MHKPTVKDIDALIASLNAPGRKVLAARRKARRRHPYDQLVNALKLPALNTIVNPCSHPDQHPGGAPNVSAWG